MTAARFDAPNIPAPSREVADAARARLDTLTKPRGSLGRLEHIAAWYAGVAGEVRPASPGCSVFVVGGDHGVARRGVSAYPPGVTAQMLANFAAGGAAISVMAQQLGARVTVVDAGASERVAGVLDRRIAAGTADFTTGPAMSDAEAVRAIQNGMGLTEGLARGHVVVPGEMGIGNTTSAAALVACFCGLPPTAVTGRGTGVDELGLATKRAAIESALRVNAPDPTQPLHTLACLGGFEIATLAGVIIGAAARQCAVVLDGFVSTAAALVAVALAPACQDYVIAGHRSTEPGHTAALSTLRLEPLLDLGLRLGEGSGAILALPLLQTACGILREMATFGEAGVSDRAEG